MDNNNKKSFASAIRPGFHTYKSERGEKIQNEKKGHNVSTGEIRVDADDAAEGEEKDSQITASSEPKNQKYIDKPALSQEETMVLQAEIEKNKAYIEKLEDLLRKMRSEQLTSARIQEEEINNTKNYAISNFAKDLLEPLENMYRARTFLSQVPDAIAEQLSAVFEGLQITIRSFEKTLEKHSLRRIYPEAGSEIFDHNLHQAVSQVTNADLPENTVLEVMQAGYMIKDRLLRPAMVIVSVR